MSLFDRLAAALSPRLAIQVGAAVLAACLLGLGGWLWLESRDARGQLALAEATALAFQAQSPSAPTEARERAAQALQSVMSEYPRLSTLPQAAYELGNLHYGAAQYAAARGAYEVALAKGATGTVRTLSALGIGYTWEAEKAYDKAAAAYEAAARPLRPADFLYEETLLDLARAQDLGGKPAAAIETYRRIVKDVPTSRRADEVRSLLARLESRGGK